MSVGYIYLIRAEGQPRYKIGRTTRHPEVRLRELNGQQAPYQLSLVHFVEVIDSGIAESYFHQKFSRYRQHGEWFEMSHSIAKAVIKAFETYQGGITHGAGQPPASKKTPKFWRRRGVGKKTQKPWVMIACMGLSILVLIQLSKSPQLLSCIKPINFSRCGQVLSGAK
jgi:hypothetical protein